MVESDLLFNLKCRQNIEIPSWMMLSILFFQFTVLRCRSCISVLDFQSTLLPLQSCISISTNYKIEALRLR
jgi:hypothetical protein